MLNVLHLSAPTGLAGAERVMLNYLENRERGHFSVRVASLLNHRRPGNSFTESLKNLDVPCDNVLIGNTSLVRQIGDVVRIITKNGIDLLHTHGYRSDITGFAAARIAGIPVVSTVHGWTPISLKLRGYESLDRFFLKRFDRVLCVSRRLHDEFAAKGMQPERLLCLPNAVSVPDLAPERRHAARKELGIPATEKLIITVGRLSPEKGLDILLTAFAALPETNVRLVIVGDGPLLSGLIHQAGLLGVREQVTFTGFAADVGRYYAAADLFVLSSLTEGTPMALLEAMAWGLPVVATAVGGVPDILQDNVNGCLVKAGNAEALAAAMAGVLGDGERAQKLGSAARTTIQERYAAKRWAREVESIYFGVTQRGKERGQ